MNLANNNQGLDAKLVIWRQHVVDSQIVKILKTDALHCALHKDDLIKAVQKRLKHRFWAQDSLIKQRISKLADDGYCIDENQHVLYLDG